MPISILLLCNTVRPPAFVLAICRLVENHRLRLKSTTRNGLSKCHQAAEASIFMVIQDLWEQCRRKVVWQC